MVQRNSNKPGTDKNWRHREVEPWLEPARVLLAEDDDAWRTLIAHALRRHGHQVVEFDSGEGLANYLDRARPGTEQVEVVVSDVRMPRGTGMAVLAGSQWSPTRPPFILMTAFVDQRLEAEALEMGAIQVIAKPCTVDTLRAAIAEATWGRRG